MRRELLVRRHPDFPSFSLGSRDYTDCWISAAKLEEYCAFGHNGRRESATFPHSTEISAQRLPLETPCLLRPFSPGARIYALAAGEGGLASDPLAEGPHTDGSQHVWFTRLSLPEVGEIGRTRPKSVRIDNLDPAVTDVYAAALTQNAQRAADVRQSETDMFSDYALCKRQAN